jgi:enediyne biosynthesis protein E4
MTHLSSTKAAASWLQRQRSAIALLGVSTLMSTFAVGAGALPTQAQPAKAIAPFTDIADANHLRPNVYQSMSRKPGVALFDFDNDGWLDIYLTNGKDVPNSLYRNNGDGSFTDVAADVGAQDRKGEGRGVAAADFNNDGWPDLYIGNAGIIGDHLDYRSGGDQGNINTLLLNVAGPGGRRVFRDVTAIAGVGDPRSASSIAAADVNGDGLLDIYVGNLGDEDFRTFQKVDPAAPSNAQRNVLYLNRGVNANGVPAFQDVAEAAGVAGPADKNRDLNGNPINTFDPNLVDAAGNKVGDNPGEQTHAVMFTDLTGDGRQDLLTGSDFGTVSVFRNDGDKNGDGIPEFTDISRLVGTNQVGNWMGFASADYDGDGRLDYFVPNMGSTVVTDGDAPGGFSRYDMQRFRWGNRMHALFRNRGTRELSGAGVIPALTNVASAIEVEPSKAMPPRALDPRNVNARFEPVFGLEAYEFGFGASFFDFENNGTPDLYWQGDVPVPPIERNFYNPGRLLLNRGDGAFKDMTIEAKALTIKDFPWDRVGQPGFDPLQFVIDHHLTNSAQAAGDLNNDGYVDLVVPTEGIPNRPGRLFILMNNNADAMQNAWVRVHTVGTTSNRDGIGAKVTLAAAGTQGPVFKQQVKEVRVGSSYMATEEKDLVFGLGRGFGGLTLRVEWPSGRVDVYHSVHANSVFEAVEGQGNPG